VAASVVPRRGDEQDALAAQGGDRPGAGVGAAEAVASPEGVPDGCLDDVDPSGGERAERQDEVLLGVDAHQAQGGLGGDVVDDLGDGGAVVRGERAQVVRLLALSEVGLDGGGQLGPQPRVVAGEADVDDRHLDAAAVDPGGVPRTGAHRGHGLGGRPRPHRPRLAHPDDAGAVGQLTQG
jgi:hypothetical protein